MSPCSEAPGPPMSRRSARRGNRPFPGTAMFSRSKTRWTEPLTPTRWMRRRDSFPSRPGPTARRRSPVGRGWPFRLGGEPVGWKLRQAELSGGRVLLAYDWTTPTQVFPVRAVLSLSGGTLCLELASEQGGPVAIDTPKLSGVLKLSDAHDTAMRGMDPVAFLGFSGDLFFVAGTRQFYSYYVDWTKSNSTAPYPELHYAPAAGKTVPLKETIAITLADALPKVLPTIPNPVSPYRAKIAGSMVLEFWYGHFDELSELLEQYHRYGMDNLIVLMHRWQNAGFDRKYPSVMPPSPSRGGSNRCAPPPPLPGGTGRRSRCTRTTRISTRILRSGTKPICSSGATARTRTPGPTPRSWRRRKSANTPSR